MEEQLPTGAKKFLFSSHLRHLIMYTKAILFLTDPEAPYSWSEEEIADLLDHCSVIMAADGREI